MAKKKGKQQRSNPIALSDLHTEARSTERKNEGKSIQGSLTEEKEDSSKETKRRNCQETHVRGRTPEVVIISEYRPMRVDSCSVCAPRPVGP